MVTAMPGLNGVRVGVDEHGAAFVNIMTRRPMASAPVAGLGSGRPQQSPPPPSWTGLPDAYRCLSVIAVVADGPMARRVEHQLDLSADSEDRAFVAAVCRQDALRFAWFN
jgi:hypothetical protein